jgi:hypothetical protein
MTLFDAYFFVDWSANSEPTRIEPKKDTIWLGELVRGSPPTERYHRTRTACVDDLSARLRALAVEGLRVLVGFDFAYGYPRGLADALGLPLGPAPWARTWHLLASRIKDDAKNKNNRWHVASDLNKTLMPASHPVGPFWNCPANAATATLRSSMQAGNLAFPFQTRAGGSLEEWRHAEKRARKTNSSVQSTWKLFTSGSVGSQALVGIPRVAKLRYDAVLAPFSKVWPFETGFVSAPSPTTGPFVLHAEIWPVLFNGEVATQFAADPKLRILDQAQVRALCVWAECTDAAGQLGQFFDRPNNLGDPEVKACVEEEGWILGLR